MISTAMPHLGKLSTLGKLFTSRKDSYLGKLSTRFYRTDLIVLKTIIDRMLNRNNQFREF